MPEMTSPPKIGPSVVCLIRFGKPVGVRVPKWKDLRVIAKQCEEDVVKNLAFVVGLGIFTVGGIGILAPSVLVWIAQHSVTSGVFYLVAIVRVAFGLALISVASASRVPKAVRVLGYVILIAGITTALTGLLAIGRARAIIDWWLQQRLSVVRLTGVLVLALGGFVAYACAPARRGA
jgi:hypothetical protein